MGHLFTRLRRSRSPPRRFPAALGGPWGPAHLSVREKNKARERLGRRGPLTTRSTVDTTQPCPEMEGRQYNRQETLALIDKFEAIVQKLRDDLATIIKEARSDLDAAQSEDRPVTGDARVEPASNQEILDGLVDRITGCDPENRQRATHALNVICYGFVEHLLDTDDLKDWTDVAAVERLLGDRGVAAAYDAS